jgi:spermidine synthase
LVELTHAEEWTALIHVAADAWLNGAHSDRRSQHALCLGLGGGVIVRSLLALNPQLMLHCVELEREVLEVAQSWFGLILNERCSASVDDATHHLQRAGSSPADVLIVDCFSADGLDAAVASGELARHVTARLAPAGLVAINTTWGIDGTARGETAHRLAHRLAAAVHGLCVYLLHASTCRNIIVCAHRGGRHLSEAEWRAMLAPALLRAASVCPQVALDGCVPRPFTAHDRKS